MYPKHPDQPDLPAAPPTTTPTGPAKQPMSRELRLVVALMFVYPALSLVLSILLLIFHTSFVNYELAHTQVPADSTVAAVRHTLQVALWVRLVGVLIIAALYVWRALSLRDGKRGTYTRLIGICVFGMAYIVYLVVSAKYPPWVRAEQAVQGIALLLLLIVLTRKPVRDRFAKS